MTRRTIVAFLLVTVNALAAGRELAPRPLIPARGFADNMSVASAGGKFLTVWQRSVGNDTAIVGALSDAGGAAGVASAWTGWIAPESLPRRRAARPR